MHVLQLQLRSLNFVDLLLLNLRRNRIPQKLTFLNDRLFPKRCRVKADAISVYADHSAAKVVDDCFFIGTPITHAAVQSDLEESCVIAIVVTKDVCVIFV